jgi:hypothetical protein
VDAFYLSDANGKPLNEAQQSSVGSIMLAALTR